MSNLAIDNGSLLDTLAQQALLEHQILQHVTAALRLSLQWQTQAVGYGKKLSTVRFTAQSFQRHLERLLTLEEGGGYMQFVRDRQPGMFHEAMALRREHDRFREDLADMLLPLERLLPEGDGARFDEACHELELLLDRLEQHHAREIDLLQETMLRDTGGEG